MNHVFHNIPVVTYISFKGSVTIHFILLSLKKDEDKGLTE